jgi:hypothetical protein
MLPIKQILPKRVKKHSKFFSDSIPQEIISLNDNILNLLYPLKDKLMKDELFVQVFFLLYLTKRFFRVLVKLENFEKLILRFYCI